MKHTASFILLSAALTAGVACSDGGDNVSVPSSYVFERAGESTVRHPGQTTRHVLIAALAAEMNRIAALTDGDASVDEPGEVTALLNVFIDYDQSMFDDRPLPGFLNEATAPLTLLQGSDLSMLGDARLTNKIAGNDEVTDHRDWDGGGPDDDTSAPSDFEGWTDTSAGADPASPERLLRSFVAIFEAQVIAYQASGVHPPGAATVEYPLYVTPEGLDLVQLTQKLALGAVAFSQTADDYLDDDVDGKGLLSDNETIGADGDTTLEHAWDEGFGYFGAAANYNEYTDEELRGKGEGRPAYGFGYNDANGDGQIDLFSEFCFGASTNAGKRDFATAGNAAPTDFTGDAFTAFVTGRAIIASAAGRALTTDEAERLAAERDAAIEAFEGALAATAVHYINETVEQIDACNTDTYDFGTHAKVWSELKGFALSLQFNPRSPFSAAAHDFVTLHTEIADAPALCDDTTALATHRQALLSARDRLAAAYAFDAANVDGW